MKENRALLVASLLSVLLFSLHLAGDIVRGFERGGASNLTAIPIFAVWLYATLFLGDRRSGLIIILLASLLSMAVPILHMRGKGLGAASVAKSDGGFFFIWTIVALGVTALFSILAGTCALWRMRGEAS